MNTARSWLLALLFVLASAGQSAGAECPDTGALFDAFYKDADIFEQAMAKAETIAPATARLSGITVPHHLLADHLMAQGMKLTAGHRYRRIILLFPDHFRTLKQPFGTVRHGFETVLDPVEIDAEPVNALLARADLGIEENCALSSDHGLRSLLPFISQLHSQTPIVPIAVSIRSTRADWERLAEALQPLMDDETLIVQSTDFSHYLPHHVARQRDQQTLNILSSGSLDDLARLVQPDHLDTLGAMYVHLAVQSRTKSATPQVLANENMQQYTDAFVAETTSYMIVGFVPDDGTELKSLPGNATYYFAGDTFFGRAMTPALSDADAADRVEAAVREATGGLPMVVNLEGVLLPDVPSVLDEMVLAMPRDLALEWFKRMNVAAVGLANNHTSDIGETGLAETVRTLNENGIPWFGQGGRLDFPGLTVVGLTDIDSNATRKADLIDADLLDRLLVEDAETPVLAFVHWGREYLTEPGPRESHLADEMRRRGVAAIIGAHPHRASTGIKALGGGDTAMLYSLGNFLFDQRSDKSSGALAKVTVFPQGTIFVRQIAIPNLFETAGSND
ncbi:MAG: AmmeMemoRadiSam system protein B [Rhizobiaceae bacterium]|nr:AmmeMemoRadiSam system protein B [Rhizobiaceae bacterium]